VDQRFVGLEGHVEAVAPRNLGSDGLGLRRHQAHREEGDQQSRLAAHF